MLILSSKQVSTDKNWLSNVWILGFYRKTSPMVVVFINAIFWRKWIEMTDQEKNLLINFELKIKQIISRHEALKEEKRRLEEKIKSLEESMNQLHSENQVLVQKYENLKLAKMLIASEEENKDAKSRIQKIVREIDKCIALLNK